MIWRLLWLFGIIVAANVLKLSWPWFPAIGLTAGLSYWVGAWGRREKETHEP